MTSSPTALRQRIDAVDMLRGAALLGILSVNVWFFASASNAVGLPDPDYASTADAIARAFTTFVFASKSYLLFAFLFGYSFVLQQQASLRAGRPFVPMMRRRLAALMLLGLLHGILLYPGDILLTYGLLGFILLAMRDIDPRTAVRRGAILTLIGGCVLLFLGALAWSAGTDGQTPDAEDFEQLARGSIGDVIALNAAAYPSALASVLLVQGLPALGAMVVGLAAARVGFVTNPALLAMVWRRLVPVGVAVGLAGAALFTVMAGSADVGVQLIGFGVTVLTAPFLTATYVMLLLRLHASHAASAVVRGVAAAGRLALTNYLGQSLALSLLFTGYGLALIEQVSAVQTVAIVIAIYTVGVIASYWWARSHRYGPAEWLLRRWSYRTPAHVRDPPSG